MPYSPRNIRIACNHGGLTHFGGVHLFHEFLRVLHFRDFLAQQIRYPARNRAARRGASKSSPFCSTDLLSTVVGAGSDPIRASARSAFSTPTKHVQPNTLWALQPPPQ